MKRNVRQRSYSVAGTICVVVAGVAFRNNAAVSAFSLGSSTVIPQIRQGVKLSMALTQSPEQLSNVIDLTVSSSPIFSDPEMFPTISELDHHVAASSSEPPPTVSPPGGIGDERREFEMKLGKAVDTLRKDYPAMLTKNPDYTIYHGDLEVVDPSGVKLHGLKNYKNAFMLIHAVINLFYCPERSLLTFRLVYDHARNNIRVSWNAELVPKLIFGGVKTTLHVDGISVYVMEKTTGLITQHRVERLLINDAHVRPKSGIFYALTRAVTDMEGKPVLGVDGGPFHFEFRQNLLPIPSGNSLFDPSDIIKGVQPLFAMSSTSDGGSDGSMAFDEKALEEKNISRKKRGLKELTPDEFVEFEAQTR
eukprot:scaffold491363_cov39-Attheya_sp.AAC.1